MYKYSIKIDLLSECIFSGGESVVSIADLDILYDEYGIPYYKAKSLKGNLREAVDMVVYNLNENKKIKYMDISEKLFGAKFNEKYIDEQFEGRLRFGNVSFDENVYNYLKNLVISQDLKSQEIISALTDIRYFNKIDYNTGVTEDGSLRSVRVLNKNITMYADVFVEDELSEDELGLLLCGVSCMRHLGSLRSRGKGSVKATLLENGRFMNREVINRLVDRVVG